MLKTIASWIHLVTVAVVVVLLNVASFVIRTTYRVFPFKSILDNLYARSGPLRELFSLGLGGVAGGPPRKFESCPELIAAAGYPVECHFCETKDGYLLGLHRIPHGIDEAAPAAVPASARSGSGSDTEDIPLPTRGLGQSSGRPPVLVIHGLMMCSDVWVVSGKERSLAFVLAEAGYDVFLGNNRGNRYSSKHATMKCRDEAFWNFSVDELARYDVPAMVDYIIKATGQPRVALVGFSQGTAQCFAALSHDHDLTSKVSCFVALSPAVTVRGLSRSLVSSLVAANEDFIYLVFGRKRIFPSTVVWQRIMSPRFFVRTIDASLKYLFSWDVSELAEHRKRALYSHIYSFSSVKCVVHWFQMIRSGRFQMFDDAPSPHRTPPQYDVRNITSVPIALFVGGKDTIIDPKRLIALLPKSTHVHWEPTYEHLDFMWAENAVTSAFPAVIAHLDKHAAGSVATPQPARRRPMAKATAMPGARILDEGSEYKLDPGMHGRAGASKAAAAGADASAGVSVPPVAATGMGSGAGEVAAEAAASASDATAAASGKRRRRGRSGKPRRTGKGRA